MRGIIENFTKVEIDYEGIHICEMKDNKTVDKITVQSLTYNVEENAHELIEELSCKLYGFLRNVYNEPAAKKHLRRLLEDIADTTVGNHIKWIGEY